MLLLKSVARNRGLWAILTLAFLLVSSGCGSGYSGPTGTVSGTVTLNGEPVPPGTGVAFLSDDGYSASAQVGVGGKYQLSVAGQSNQIPAATYKVMISQAGGGQMSEADYDAMMQANASGTAAEPAQPKEEIIPAKYKSTATSGLSYKVEAGSNTIDINLGEGGAAPVTPAESAPATAPQ